MFSKLLVSPVAATAAMMALLAINGLGANAQFSGGVPENLPPCLLSCLIRPVLSSGCGFGNPDATCICTSAVFQTGLTECVPAECEPEQVPAIYEAINTQFCGAVEGWVNVTVPAAASSAVETAVVLPTPTPTPTPADDGHDHEH